MRFNIAGRDSFDIARREILLRKIGDELLTQSGDNRSKVLPVKKIAENEYQISFEHGLTFHPDSLVNTTRRLLAQDPLASDYVVNVLNCSDSSVAYGYAISNNTGTEARLLLIFALSPNQTIERSRVQKEIWEGEGIPAFHHRIPQNSVPLHFMTRISTYQRLQIIAA